jgi:hypothetical protein
LSFCNKDIIQVYPFKSKSKSLCHQALQDFIDNIGVPNKLVLDGAREQAGPHRNFVANARKVHMPLKMIELYTQRQNRAEFAIRELKWWWRSNLAGKNIPKNLLDYGIPHEAEILSHIARGQDGRTSLERLTGETTDISEWLLGFELYNLVLVLG